MNIFNSKKYNSLEKEEDREEIVQILSHFIENPFSISGIESEFKHYGKKAIRDITRNTIYFLVVLLMVQIALDFFWLCKDVNFLQNNFGKIFFHPFSVAVWIYLFPMVGRWIILFLSKKLYKKEGEEYARYLLIDEKSKFNNACVFITFSQHFNAVGI